MWSWPVLPSILVMILAFGRPLGASAATTVESGTRAQANVASTSTTTMAASVSTTMPLGSTRGIGIAPCAQPISVGPSPTATDCLFILGVAVGLAACDPPCVCDVNGDFQRTASDALICLKVAVGVSAPLDCPCGTTSTTLLPRTGPCCVRGFCSIELPGQCAGVYLGPSDSVTCSATEQLACENPPTTSTSSTTTTTTMGDPTGACCGPRGCLVTTAADCNGVYLGDGDQLECTSQDLEACASLVTTTIPATTTTLAGPPTGACCGARGCTIETAGDCRGQYLGDSDHAQCTLEDLADCASLTTTTSTVTSMTTTTTLGPGGVCCIRGFCTRELEADCFGTFLGEGTTCTPENEAVCEGL
jgi:hypothetical protein